MIDPHDLQASSSQMNAVDFVKPIVFRIVKVDYNPKKEQPIALHLEGHEGRPWMPCKSMLRGLTQVWSMDETTWTGKLVELFCDNSVKWAGAEVGGIRASAVSGIDKPYEFPLQLSRSKRVIHTFNVLPDDQAVTKEFILTHHEASIAEAKTDAEITAIVKAIQAEFGDEKLGELKQTVLDARANLKAGGTATAEEAK